MELAGDSAFYGHPAIGAAIGAGADVSVTEYTAVLYDEVTDTWISRAAVAEIPFTALASQAKAHQIPRRLVVRRIPDLRPTKDQA